MKLLRATIRNYRVHRELTVEFAHGVTAIAAPNEYGKSTLLEAVHRALFLKHRTASEVRKAMGSRHGGHPEVELQFEAAGSRYALRKLFSGQSGVCELVDETRGRTWRSDEAESQLAQLVGREPGRSKKELDAAWDHLWVRQGEASGDPLQTAGAKDLLRVLDGSLGEAEAEALVAGDARVLELLRERVEATWTKNRDSTKKDSEARRTAARRDEVSARLDAARARREGREAQVVQLQDFRSSLARASRSLAEIGPQLKACAERHAELERIRTQHEQSALEQKRLADELGRLDELAAELAAARDALEPAEAAERASQEEERVRRAAFDSAKVASTDADDNARDAEQAVVRLRDAAALQRARRELQRRREDEQRLRREADEFAKRKLLVDEARVELERAVPMREQEVAALQARERELQSVKDRLDGAAVRLLRRSGTSDLRVDGAPLAMGSSLRVTDVAEVRFADGSVVEVAPGGAELQGLRQQRADAETSLRDALSQLGVATVEAARAALLQRTEIASRLAQREAELRGARDPGPELAKLPGVVEGLVREVGEAEARGVTVASDADPEALARDAEREGQRAKALRELATGAATSLGKAEKAKNDAADHARGAAMKATEVRAKRDELLRQAGDEVAFEQQRVALREQHASGAAAARAAEEQLADLPRVKESLLGLQKQERELYGRIEGLKSNESFLSEQLQGSHAEDLDAVIDELMAELARAERLAVTAHARAEGEKLLLELMEGMQREQRTRREAPFVAACNRYLAIAHGPGMRLGLDGADDRVLGRIDRSRVGLGAFAFGELSQGGRELVALAVRLAMAEVLAKEQSDGALPLVLDDAVTNVDPERLRAVGHLLTEAAQHGVQVVFATCDVERATWLRAERLVELPRPSWGSNDPVRVDGE